MSRSAPPARMKESKSAAVRAALAKPSKRQHSKWQRERQQRMLIFGSAAAILLAIVLVLGFGWLREIVLRPTEPAATVGDQVISVGQLVQRVKPQLAAIDNEIMRLAMQAPQGASTSATDTTTRQLQSLRGQ